MMKKNYFVGAIALCGMLTLGSCSNDDDPIIDGPNNEVAATGEQVIVLDMQDTDVLSTKSRPLYSTTNKGAELVTDVQLLVFGIKDGADQYEFVKKLTPITNWNNNSEDYNFGRKKTIKLTEGDKLKESEFQKYIILAVGQDESNLNAIPAPFKIELGDAPDADKFVKELADNTWTAGNTYNWNTGNGFMQTVALDYTKTDGTQRVGEIFSGTSTPLEFTASQGFTTTVLLKRQVAGVLGYFNNIPAIIDGTPVTGIRLVASNRNNALNLTKVLADQVDDATYNEFGHEKIEKVVNGFTSTDGSNNKDAHFGTDATADDAYVMYKIDLKEWFEWGTDAWDESAYVDANVDDTKKLLGGVAGWHNALDASNSTIRVADGSVFAGEFVIPFDKNDQNTFELQLTSEKGDVLKTWSVKLDQLSQDDKNNALNYNIYRNHLYQIGKRGSGDNPTDPGTDPDKPQPLDNNQELIIKINDQWEFIHDMEIE